MVTPSDATQRVSTLAMKHVCHKPVSHPALRSARLARNKTLVTYHKLQLDHDVCSNYGNWNYAAGIGNDPRENRKFNMVKQAFDYDPKGDFVRCWVPELARLKEAMIHTPWKLTASQLSSAGVDLGETYPNPVLVAPEWGRHQPKGMHGKGPAAKGPRQRGIDFYFKSPPKM
ncbi:Cryptochrome DASH [Chionoecetes opilio]|uniref:Cryptochrome DASH n=1 Tax=Chionoecetes opilio TaxID=41210 RepID=A0A8J4XQQ6_CHIOP|nr:Cryptochrome DASH [Chionoecetes opilio]